MKGQNMRKTIKLCVLILAVAAVLTASVMLVHRHRTDKYAFTVEKWNAYKWNDRQLLIGDFLKQYNLNSVTRTDVIQLLGDEPDFYNDFPVRYKTENNLVYDFGAEITRNSSGNISLVITLDGQERVAGYELVRYSW